MQDLQEGNPKPVKSTSVKAQLREILLAANPNEKQRACTFPGFSRSQLEVLQQQEYDVYQGDVRQCLSHQGKLILVHTDRLSAFERAITLVPYKGLALNQISTFWFETIRSILPSAYLASDHRRSLLMKKLRPLKVEVIVRGYLAGSMLRAYERGERTFCGETLVDGLPAYGALARPIITPVSKAESHPYGENRSPEELINEGVCSRSEWQEISRLALSLFQIGSQVYASKGWLLVDTKYEFGRDETGRLYIIDEIHTPDSSRLWKAETYSSRLTQALPPEMLDKEIIRRYLVQHGFQGKGPIPPIPLSKIIELAEIYVQVAECLTGEELLIDERDYSLTPLLI